MDTFGGVIDNFGGMERRRQHPARPSEPRQIVVVCGEDPGVWPDILARAEAAVECLRRRGAWRLLTVGRIPQADWVSNRIVVGMLFSSAAVRDVPGLLATGIPAVDLGEPAPAAPWPAVPVDEPAIGRMAARHLVERGYRRFAAVDVSQGRRSAARVRGFVDQIRRDGGAADVRTGKEGTKDWIERQVRQDANPLGLFAATDDWAEWIVSGMLGRGVAIPRQMGVVGVGDSRPVGLLGLLPLSTVQLPTAAIGAAAADILLALIEGRPPPHPPPLPPVRVIQRESTGMVCTADPLVTRALAHMTGHVREPHEPQLAAAMNISVRQLRARFTAAIGCGPAAVWHRIQIDAAEDLLLRTNLPVDDIAPLCGYGGARQFIRAFKAAVGQTPDRWRRAARTPVR
jgi:AraC-like DNA-binding protein